MNTRTHSVSVEGLRKTDLRPERQRCALGKEEQPLSLMMEIGAVAGRGTVPAVFLSRAREPVGGSIQDGVSEMLLRQFGGAQGLECPGGADVAARQDDSHVAAYPVTVGLFG